MSISVSLPGSVQEISWAYEPTTIDLVGEIGEDMISTFDELLDQAVRSPQSHVIVAIHSCGGCTYTGFHMVNRLRTCGKPVVTVVRSRAWSAAALIAVAGGTPGCRYMTEHASLLIHEVQETGDNSGSFTEIENETTQHRKLNDVTFRMFDESAGQTAGWFKRRYLASGSVDMYFDAAESKKCGLVDVVGDPVLHLQVQITSRLTIAGDDEIGPPPHRQLVGARVAVTGDDDDGDDDKQNSRRRAKRRRHNGRYE